MPLETVTATIDGRKYSGWESVSVERSMESLASTFNLTALNRSPADDGMAFKNGMPVTIDAGTDRLITGYLNSINPQVASDGSSLSLSGRCKTQDLVDCSAELPSAAMKGASLFRIATTLVKPYGIQIVNNSGSSSIEARGFMLNAGETVFEALQRLCADRALLCNGNEDGQLVLTTAGNNRASTSLVYGVNIKSASGTYTDADRFSAYEVKGDAGSDGGGWGASTVAIAAKSADNGVKRYRYKLIKATEAMTRPLAQKKANWEAQIRAGRAGEVTVQLAGWRQENAQLWRVNELVPVDIAPLLIQKTSLLITRVMYRQDASGTVCDLTLKRPDVYAPDPTENVKKAKTDTVWG